MTEDEEGKLDAEALTPIESARFAALSRTQPVNGAREDQLVALLVEQGVVMRPAHFTPRSILALMAAAVMIFVAGTWTGFVLRPSRAESIGVVTSPKSRSRAVLASSRSTSAVQAPPELSRTGRKLIWF